jgi:O-antigen/teichoic acid export membrane protein
MQKFLGYIKSTLNKLSKIFKTDLNYIARGGSFLGLSSISSAISGFLLTLAFANFLPQENYGIYKYILSTYALITILGLPGIDAALLETIPKGNHGALRHGMLAKFKWCLLASLGSLVLAIYNFYTNQTEFGYLFIVTALTFP